MVSLPIVLASNSPRRRELLGWTGWEFTVSPMDIDESRRAGEAPGPYVLRLARGKAAAAARKYPRALIIGSDTTVCDGDELLGKPAGPQEAVQMLRRLRGRVHQVYTALAFISRGGKPVTELCVSQVPMRDFTDEEIEAYVARGEPLDKAGAYGIQDRQFHPVDVFAGCYASVMGMPLCHLARVSRRLGMTPPNDVALVCQTALSYDCPIHRAVANGENVG